jgi:hypothetical protein
MQIRCEREEASFICVSSTARFWAPVFISTVIPAFGIIQGTFVIVQGTFGIIQGTFGIIQGTFGIGNGMRDLYVTRIHGRRSAYNNAV